VPTYQYTCTECGHDLEAVQSFSDAPLSTCPACDGRLRKVFSAVGVVFKGSGFYRTDSRANGAKKDAAAASDGSSTKTESTSPSSSSTGKTAPRGSSSGSSGSSAKSAAAG